mgnify:CR=1 FL=1
MTLKGRFSFDATAHLYRIGQYQVPGTSAVLEAAGYLAGLRRASGASRWRGEQVHALAAAVDMGTLASEPEVRRWLATHSGPAPLAGWLAGYRAFMAGSRPRYTLIETPVVDRRRGFATVVDRAGWLFGAPMVLNLKSGAKDSAHAVQRALEVLALDGRRSRRRRFTLYLRPSGRFRLEEHINDGDFDAAEEALILWRQHAHDPARHYPLRLVRPFRRKAR